MTERLSTHTQPAPGENTGVHTLFFGEQDASEYTLGNANSTWCMS